jgi:hypothetical protein
MTGSKYLNASKAIKQVRILWGASLLEKNRSGEDSAKSFFKKVCTIIITARIIRMTEPSKGKSPAPGELKDPMG